MANSILSSIFSAANFTAVDSDSGFTLWPSIKVIEVEIGVRSATSDEPLSVVQYVNQTVSQSLQEADVQASKIILPSNIRVTAIASDLSTLESIISSFANTQLTIDITSKSVISSSMVVVDLEIEQTPRMISAARLVMELQQAIPPSSPSFDPSQTADQNTYGVRIQTLPSATTTIASLYSSVTSFFGV